MALGVAQAVGAALPVAPPLLVGATEPLCGALALRGAVCEAGAVAQAVPVRVGCAEPLPRAVALALPLTVRLSPALALGEGGPLPERLPEPLPEGEAAAEAEARGEGDAEGLAEPLPDARALPLHRAVKKQAPLRAN